MEDALRRTNQLKQNPNITEVIEMYSVAFPTLEINVRSNTDHQRRIGEMVWTTIVRDLRASASALNRDRENESESERENDEMDSTNVNDMEE
jgi:hypothetical protein